jgi:hypothetical protein
MAVLISSFINPFHPKKGIQGEHLEEIIVQPLRRRTKTRMVILLLKGAGCIEKGNRCSDDLFDHTPDFNDLRIGCRENILHEFEFFLAHSGCRNLNLNGFDDFENGRN